jgi:hypothetical protein
VNEPPANQKEEWAFWTKHAAIGLISLVPQVAVNLLPRVLSEDGFHVEVADIGMLVLLILAGLCVAAVSALWHRSTTGEKWALASGGLFMVALNFTCALEMGERIRAVHPAKVAKQEREVKEIKRKIAEWRQPRWVVVGFAHTTDQMVDAAREALDIAKKNKELECAPRKNGLSGQNCVKKQTAEKATLDFYNKRVKERDDTKQEKAAIDAIEKLEAELAEKQVPPKADPAMKGLAKLIDLLPFVEIDLTKEDPAEAVGEYWSVWIAFMVEVATVLTAIIARIILFPRRREYLYVAQQSHAPTQNAQVNADAARAPAEAWREMVAEAVRNVPREDAAVSPFAAAADAATMAPTGMPREDAAEFPRGVAAGLPHACRGKLPREDAAVEKRSRSKDAALPQSCRGRLPQEDAAPRAEGLPQVAAAHVARDLVPTHVEGWIRACVRRHPAGSVRMQDAYDSYESWCRKHEITPLAYRQFTAAMRKIPWVKPVPGPRKQKGHYEGFTLVAQDLRVVAEPATAVNTTTEVIIN